MPSRRSLIIGGVSAYSFATLTDAMAQAASPTKEVPPLTDAEDDRRRSAFAASLLGRGRKSHTATATVRGQTFEYDLVLGAIELKDESGGPTAHFVHTAYTRLGLASARRPITFIWGGGPSGPAGRLQFLWGPHTRKPDGLPAEFLPHEEGVLDRTDLVFVDPVGTGWSVPAGAKRITDFYSVARDGMSVAQFVKRYLQESGRLGAPVYLSGRSYGTIRLPTVTHYLQASGVPVAGTIFIAAALNGFTSWNTSGNLAAYYMKLPNYAAVAWREKRQLRAAPSCAAAVAEAGVFATGDYVTALLRWDTLSESDRRPILRRLHELTGVSAEVWAQHRGRMTKDEFKVALIPPTKPAAPVDIGKPPAGEDPVNVLVRTSLGVANAPSYRPLAPGLYVNNSPGPHPWDTTDFRSFADIDGYLVATFADYSSVMAEAMRTNPALRVQQHSGYYDLGCNSFSTNWEWHNLDIPDAQRANIELFDYEADHGVSEGPENTRLFLDRLADFYRPATS